MRPLSTYRRILHTDVFLDGALPTTAPPLVSPLQLCECLTTNPGQIRFSGSTQSRNAWETLHERVGDAP